MRASGTSTGLRYPGSSLTVALEDAPEVEQALRRTMRGWHPETVAPSQAPDRLSLVRREGTGFTTRSIFIDETLHGLGVASATCAVIADLAQDFIEARPGSLALHCGAFRFKGRLVALTGPSRAGKSTLIARLSAEPDIEVFCDDVLPLSGDGRAFGLGIAPRLRLPLPPGASVTFKDHVATHLGPHDENYGYICAPTVAPHGTSADLSVVVILDRRKDAKAALHAVRDGEALRYLLSQNMTDLLDADMAFGRMSDLLAKVDCFRLVYSDLEEAVALLRAGLDADDGLSSGTVIHPSIHAAQDDTLPAAQTVPTRRWMRDTGIILQVRDDAAFLWKTGTPMIWHMNALAHAIWVMLEMPGSAVEIGQTLASEFSDEDEGRIIDDVNALLQALARAGMVVPVAEDSAAP